MSSATYFVLGNRKFSQWRLLLGLLVLPALAVGCKPQEEIRVSVASRNEPPRREFDAETARGQLDHMFAAIVPHERKAWFFKVVAPAAVAQQAGAAFQDFIKTVSVESVSPSAKTPEWQLPEGWQLKPATGMRDATIEMPVAGSTLELSVSSLPAGDDWSQLLTANVNRWLGQLQQAPLDEGAIEALVEKQSIGGGTATLIELVGAYSTPQMGGLAGGGLPASHPPIESSDSSSSPPTDSSTDSKAATQSDELSFDAPTGWTTGRPSSMRKASFAADGGVDISVTAFPNRAQMGDLGFNLQRWAGEVALTNDSPDELIQQAEAITVGGDAGHFVELVGPDKGTLAAMIPRGEMIWFFKLTGPADAVQKQSPAFGEFLDSVQFAGL